MSVATKNLYDLLGNNVEEDEPRPLVKPVEKTSTHTVKRNTDGLPPSKGPATSGNRRGGAKVSGNEAVFRDRDAGRESNRAKPTDAPQRGGRRGGFRERGDRRPYRSAPHSNSEKQAEKSWGAAEGESELKDEKAGAEIAESEKKADEEGGEAETKEEGPEEKQMTYDQYLAQLEEKKVDAELRVRKPNEGVNDSKWKDFTPLKRDENEDYVPGTGGKTKRERERKAKQYIEIDNRYKEPERPRGGRGGRGGARGDGGRGRGRGGAPRSGRGGRAQDAAPIDTNDETAFPSLGGN
ncbi:uncharacterized protein P884DRAFT_677 [Thermothelomyces heterothallicus CBS 202.75]|uniref:uncharacterized protein n=1 Tax=Thermothelomyces heterothallicus CBS 202.75 TaxID=1149848 RepID=UPI003742704B